MSRALGAKARRVSWKMRRRIEDLSYWFRSAGLRAPAVLKPSVTALTFILIAFSAFVLSGGVYNILEQPISLLPLGREQWGVVYPGSISRQVLSESLIAAMLYLMGLAGVYMVFRSTKFVYRPRHAYILLILGFLITLSTLFYMNFLFTQKLG